MEEKKEKWWKKFSTFQLVCMAIIVILLIAIIVEVCVIVNLKNKIQDTQDKNEEIESQLPPDEEDAPTDSENIYREKLLYAINSFEYTKN